MGRQTEITEKGNLLNDKGELVQPGWSRAPLWRYDRNSIKAGPLGIKEWDYYNILSPDLKRGITFTVSDLSYAGLMAICYLDFERNDFVQVDTIAPLTLGKLTKHAPGGDPAHEVIEFSDKKLSIRYELKSGKRNITFSAPWMDLPGGGTGLSGDITLDQPPELESINIATSWKENPRRFYYNRKINCMPASGYFNAGDSVFQLNAPDDMGGLDWGRGAWTYRNRWYWSSASGLLHGKSFGFNLGYGFSDRTPATENTLFYEGRAHKLEDVEFFFDPDNYMKPWTIRDNTGRLDLDFRPSIDRSSAVNLLVIRSLQHQVFGAFSGKAVLDDGTELVLKDFPGFAEDVYNRY
ncbi:MAG: DUF2804 domain-containing protein [Spirochaetales bacterium]|nr:DUF2804 domain-containing protein [Spirochaetales bacterium]